MWQEARIESGRAVQPKPEDYNYELDEVLGAVVGIRVLVPPDAFTAEVLGTQVAKMVDQIIKGETVEVNDTTTYDNGKKVVPSFLLPPQVVTKDTVQKDFVDSGFYKASDIGL